MLAGRRNAAPRRRGKADAGSGRGSDGYEDERLGRAGGGCLTMALDTSAIGREGPVNERSWSSKDALLYAVGVGAGLGDLS